MAIKAFKDDGKLIVHKKTDPNAALLEVKRAREIPSMPMADSRHIGRIDAHVLEMWLKEEGIAFHDKPAMKEMLLRRLASSDNAAWKVDDRPIFHAKGKRN